MMREISENLSIRFKNMALVSAVFVVILFPDIFASVISCYGLVMFLPLVALVIALTLAIVVMQGRIVPSWGRYLYGGR